MDSCQEASSKIKESDELDGEFSKITSDFRLDNGMRRELCQGVRWKEAEKIFSPSFGESLLRVFYRAALEWLERILNIKIIVELPKIIRDMQPDLWPVLRKIISLKDKGLIEDFYYTDNFFNDEPKLVNFALIQKKEDGVSLWKKSAGRSFSDEKRAMLSALGEMVERFSLKTFYPKNMIRASFTKLGREAVNPELFSNLSQSERLAIQESLIFQKNHPGMKLVFNQDTQFGWVKARTFLDGQSRYVPAQLISLDERLLKKENSFIRFPLSTGAAAGENLEQAILNGMLEVIERDAFMITWLNRLAPEKIDLETGSEKIKNIARIFRRYNLEFYVLSLPTDFQIPVFLGVVIDRSGLGPAVAVGTKASFSLSNAIESVAEDALAVRSAMRHKTMKSGLPELKHLALENRAYVWYSVEMIAKIESFLNGEKKPLEYFEKKYSLSLLAKGFPAQLQFLADRLKELKLNAYWVDITNKKLSYLNIPSVMVLIPGMQALYTDECFPYAEGERLKSVPPKFGFKPAENINNQPHPFA
jgi:ribosomal protein S12 methylthiotransferase accessory factor